jgi:hypothetical protein
MLCNKQTFKHPKGMKERKLRSQEGLGVRERKLVVSP